MGVLECVFAIGVRYYSTDIPAPYFRVYGEEVG